MGEAIVWWLTLQLLGVIAFPIGALALRSVPDRGYAVAKVLGLLLTGWLAYLLAMGRLMPFGRALLLLCALAVAGFSLWLLLRKGRALLREIQGLLRERAFLRYVLVAETLFTVAYIAWTVLRAHDPDIFFTEKFMDFGFMNAIVKSDTFPPNDMWLSGHSINYYYFGYVLMASLSLLSGVPTETGYNLANVTLFSLTALGAFGVAFNLTAATVRRRAAAQSQPAEAAPDFRSRPRRAQAQALPDEAPVHSVPTRRVHKANRVSAAKLTGTSTVPVQEKSATDTTRITTGGGDGKEALEETTSHAREIPKSVKRTKSYDSPALFLDSERRTSWFLSPYPFGVLAALMVVGMGHLTTLFAVKDGNRMEGNGWRYCFNCQKPSTFDWFSPSRVIADYKYVSQGGQPPQKIREEVDPINEFPAFSFVLADMHPHVMALPIWMLTLYFTLALARRRVRRVGTGYFLKNHETLYRNALWVIAALALLIIALLRLTNTLDLLPASIAAFVIILLRIALWSSAWIDDLPHGLGAWLTLFLVALIIGSLYVTNTWDYPTFLLLALSALAVPYMAFQRKSEQPRGWRWMRPWLVQSFLIVPLSLLAFIPFHLTFKSLVGSQPADIPANLANMPILGWILQKLGSLVAINPWDKGIVGFLVIFGIFLVAILGWLAYETGRYFLHRREYEPVAVEAGVLGGLITLTIAAAVLLRFPLLALLLPMAIICLHLAWREPELVHRNVVLIMVALTSLIGLAIEVVYLRDIFNARQNTIFKFYYQIWVLWAIAAAYGVWHVMSAAFNRGTVTVHHQGSEASSDAGAPAKAAAAAWAGVFALLVMSGLVYLIYAYMNKTNERAARGLDGAAYFAADPSNAPDDLPAINWLKQNATGDDVVLECCRDEYNNPGYAGRVSSFTGVPTLLAWGGHEAQWRGGQPELLAEVNKRRGIVNAIYTAQPPANTREGLLRTLQEYSVDFIFVGATERGSGRAAGGDPGERITPEAEELFKQTLTEVFRSGQTVIYGVGDVSKLPPLPTPTPIPQMDPNVPPVSIFTLGQGGINRGQFNLPRGIARDASGNFYVADTGNMRIQKFDPLGNWLAMFGSGKGDSDGQFGQLREDAVGTGPGGIAVDAQGNIYVADTWNHRIQKFDATGKFLTLWGSFIDLGDRNTANDPDKDRKFYGPRGVAVGPGGDIYVTDTGNKRVVVFDTSGTFKSKIESGMSPERTASDYPFSQPGEMSEPIGITVDAQSNVYVADTLNKRIQKFDAAGKPLAQWPVPGGWELGQYLEPFLAVDQAGNLYATAPTGKKVLKFSPSGELLGEKSGQDGKTLTLPTGLTVDAEGNVYVVDTRGNGVIKLSPSDW